MMKRTLALLLALLLLAAPSALAQSRWADVYADFLAKNTMTEVEKAYLADLNLDGTPELIAQTGRNLVFHTVQNDALKALGALQGDTPPSGMMLALFRAKNAYRWISYIEEPSGDKSILELSLQNGQLMYKSRFSYDHAGGQSHFFVGMRETSEAKFTKALTAYEKTLGNAIIGAVESAPGVLPAAQMERMAADWEKLAVDAIPAKSLSLKPAKKTLAFGDTFSLNAAVKPASATGKITWTSDNETLVAVDETGDLLVVGYEGTANITAAINGHSKTCKITVVRPKPETVTIKGDLWAQVGGTCQLTATVKPASATGKVVWTSSDEKLVTVDELGNLKVVGFEGETTVTASIGKLSKTCKVTVKRPAASEIEVTGIACVKVGETRQLTATVYPLGAHQEVAWTSSDETVARVSETGLVTGLKQGITVITAADQENEYSFVFTVTEADETQTGAVTRRAVLVSGAGDYDDQDIFAYEAMQMRNALQQSAFAGAGRMNTVHIKDCPSAPKVLEIIKEELQDADEDDVSYVYINSHGGEPTADGTYVMYIGTGEYGYQDFITGQELRSALDAVRGKIVVILEPCFSGSVIAKGTNTPADWANGFLKAFAAKPIAKSGELATEKYYVITAASQTQSAYYNPSDKIDGLTLNRYYGSGLMNQSMCEAMGWDSWKGAKMAWLSDVNEDGKITLSELYNYVWPRVRELYYLLGNDNGEEYANTGVQHVQVWPENSDYVIFEK